MTLRKLKFQKSLLVISEILGLFVKALIDDDKYSFCNRENLPKPIQMKLCKKQNFFSQFFAAILKSALKKELHSNS